MPHFETGSRIGNYELEKPIGNGAFGEVWQARHRFWTHERVAIKIATDPKFARNLETEARVARGLAHPNIARVLDVDPWADPPYLVMELVPGADLGRLIGKSPLPWEHAVAILRQVLSGLAEAHARGVVHQDIKPANVLIRECAAAGGFTEAGCVKIADFGVGVAATRAAADSIKFTAEQTPAGTVAGTPNYMAPEQIAGGEITARTDLYQCGVLLFQMLTAKLPQGVDSPSDLNPQSPEFLDDVYGKACEEVEHRYTTAEEFARALDRQSAAQAAEQREEAPEPSPSISSRATVPRAVLIGSALAAFAVVAWACSHFVSWLCERLADQHGPEACATAGVLP